MERHGGVITAESATVVSAAHACSGDPLWEVWGRNAHRFQRDGDRWLVKGSVLEATHQRGNFRVRVTSYK